MQKESSRTVKIMLRDLAKRPIRSFVTFIHELEIHRDEILIIEPTHALTCAPSIPLGLVVGAVVAEQAADALGAPGRSSGSLQYMPGCRAITAPCDAHTLHR